MRQVQQLQAEIAALKRCQGQEVDSTESGVADDEALKEVISKLNPHDKIVQISFDEVFTSKRMIYSRTEDKLLGRGLLPKEEVSEYIAVPLFGARSLLTPFNILLSATRIHYAGDIKQIIMDFSLLLLMGLIYISIDLCRKLVN